MNTIIIENGEFMETEKNMVGYCRVSRDKQDPSSQVRLMQEDMKIPIEQIFVDYAGGAIEPGKRQEYKKMMDFISMKKPDALVVSEFSRLGRNAKESLYELMRIEHMGIKVISLSEHEKFINDLPAELQTLVTSGMMLGADLERKHCAERTRWGVKNAKEKGTRSGKPIGRPVVTIDWEKIEEQRVKYGVSLNMARKLCGYKPSKFYGEIKKRKMEQKQQVPQVSQP